jgi:2'-5' RNA ligase
MTYLTPDTAAPAPSATAVIAAVPEAGPLVERHRQRLDAAAGWGVPAHVTVLYPFVPPAAVTPDVVATLAAAVASVRAFDCRFARSRWFGQEVLWLDPEPDEPFRRLTAAAWAAFPHQPPYGGAFDDPVPHLTVAESRIAGLPAAQAAERAVQEGLPVLARVDRLLLIAGADAPRSWRVLHELPLGTDDRSTA